MMEKKCGKVQKKDKVVVNIVLCVIELLKMNKVEVMQYGLVKHRQNNCALSMNSIRNAAFGFTYN